MAKRISKKLQNEETQQSSPTSNTNTENTENIVLKKVASSKAVKTVKKVPKKNDDVLYSEQNNNVKTAEPINNASNRTEENKKPRRNSAKKISVKNISDADNAALPITAEPEREITKNEPSDKKINKVARQKNDRQERLTDKDIVTVENAKNIPQQTLTKTSNEVLQGNENKLRNKRDPKERKIKETVRQDKAIKNDEPLKVKIADDRREKGTEIKQNVQHTIKKQSEHNNNRNQNQKKSDNNLKTRNGENRKAHEGNITPVRTEGIEQQSSIIEHPTTDIQGVDQRRKKKRRNKKGKNRAEFQDNRVDTSENQNPNRQKSEHVQNQNPNRQKSEHAQNQNPNRQKSEHAQNQNPNKQKSEHVQRQNPNKQSAQIGQKQNKPQHVPIHKMGGKHVPALLEKPKTKPQTQTTKVSDIKEAVKTVQKQNEVIKPEANKGKHRVEDKTKKNVKGTDEQQNKPEQILESKNSEKLSTKNQEKQTNKQKHQKHSVKEEKEQIREQRDETKQSEKSEKDVKGEKNEPIGEQKYRGHDSGRSYTPIPLPQPIVLQKKSKSRHRAPQPLKIGNYSEFALTIIEKVEHFLLKSLSIPDGSSILLAVSGGVDSIVMADIFSYISSKHDFEIQVAHINHNLRGKESDDDERSVKGFCKRCGLRFHSARVQVKEYAKKNKISIETAARNLRYNSLDKQARSCAAEYVATAHTADDAAETFLFNIFRGAGITGLSGIPSERPLSKKINLVRPLLSLRKDEIVEYAKNRGLFWREDSSNMSLLYTRNKIRLKLLPHLRELFGNSVVEVVNRTASLMQGVDLVMQDLLDIFIPKNVQQVEYGAFSISLIGLKTQADFIKGEIFQSVLVNKMNQSNQPMATIQRIIDLCDADVNTVADVNGQVIAIRERDSIVLSKRKKVFEYYKSISLDSEIVEKEWIVRLSTVQKRPKEWADNPLIEYIDADLLPKQLTLRSWRNGDRFQPLGMQGHTSVSDFLTNTKVKALDRKKTLVLCAGTEIIWILGKRISEQFRIKQGTQKIIKVEFIHRNQNETEEK